MLPDKDTRRNVARTCWETSCSCSAGNKTETSREVRWIRVLGPGEATGELAGLYQQVAERSGSVDNILTVHSLNPASLRAHYELYKTLMYGPSELSRAQREMVAVVVSVVNRCHY